MALLTQAKLQSHKHIPISEALKRYNDRLFMQKKPKTEEDYTLFMSDFAWIYENETDM